MVAAKNKTSKRDVAEPNTTPGPTHSLPKLKTEPIEAQAYKSVARVIVNAFRHIRDGATYSFVTYSCVSWRFSMLLGCEGGTGAATTVDASGLLESYFRPDIYASRCRDKHVLSGDFSSSSQCKKRTGTHHMLPLH